VYGSPREITLEALRGAFTDASVRTISTGGGSELEFRMVRSAHDVVLDEIEAGVAQFGLTFAEAVIRRWVTLAAEGATAGAIVGAGGGALTARDPLVIATATGVGTLVGGFVGSLFRREVARYVVSRDVYGRWHISELNVALAPPLCPTTFA
jgi:hypothetical protein